MEIGVKHLVKYPPGDHKKTENLPPGGDHIVSNPLGFSVYFDLICLDSIIKNDFLYVLAVGPNGN